MRVPLTGSPLLNTSAKTMARESTPPTITAGSATTSPVGSRSGAADAPGNSSPSTAASPGSAHHSPFTKLPARPKPPRPAVRAHSFASADSRLPNEASTVEVSSGKRSTRTATRRS